MIKSKDAWLYAASWGSYMNSWDPGACMYGFNENCKPQSEEHRQDVLNHIEVECRPMVVANPEHYDDGELEKMDEFIEFIKIRELVTPG